MPRSRNLTTTLPLFLLVFTLYINAEVPVRNENTDRLNLTVNQNSRSINVCRCYAFNNRGMMAKPLKNNKLTVGFLNRPLHFQDIACSWDLNNLIHTISGIQPRVIHLINYEKNIFISRFR